MFKRLVGNAHDTMIFRRRTRVLAQELGALSSGVSGLLDVGTGDGSIAAIISENRHVPVSGIDVLLRPDPLIPVDLFDGHRIPHEDDSVDVVMFVDVLHHTENPDELLSEAARVARKYVLIKDHLAENRMQHAILGLMDWVGNAPHGVVLPYSYASRTEWMRRFAAAGMEVDRFKTDIPLYAWPLSAVFGRSLHFIARLRTVREK